MNQKKSCIFSVKLTATNAKMEGPIIGYVRICGDPLARSHGGNLDPVWAPIFFVLF